jgi:hypothetical protein
MGSCVQVIDSATGQLRWAFVPDPYREVTMLVADPAYPRHGKRVDAIIGEQYVPMIASFHYPDHEPVFGNGWDSNLRLCCRASQRRPGGVELQSHPGWRRGDSHSAHGRDRQPGAPESPQATAGERDVCARSCREHPGRRSAMDRTGGNAGTLQPCLVVQLESELQNTRVAARGSDRAETRGIQKVEV